MCEDRLDSVEKAVKQRAFCVHVPLLLTEIVRRLAGWRSCHFLAVMDQNLEFQA